MPQLNYRSVIVRAGGKPCILFYKTPTLRFTMYDLQLQIGDCRFSLRRSLLNSYRCQTNAARHSPFTFDVSLSHLTIDYFRQRERNLQSVISRYMQPVNLYSFRKKLSL